MSSRKSESVNGGGKISTKRHTATMGPAGPCVELTYINGSGGMVAGYDNNNGFDLFSDDFLSRSGLDLTLHQAYSEREEADKVYHKFREQTPKEQWFCLSDNEDDSGFVRVGRKESQTKEFEHHRTTKRFKSPGKELWEIEFRAWGSNESGKEFEWIKDPAFWPKQCVSSNVTLRQPAGDRTEGQSVSRFDIYHVHAPTERDAAEDETSRSQSAITTYGSTNDRISDISDGIGGAETCNRVKSRL